LPVFYFQNHMSALVLLILILATWRISSLLVNEDGPYSVLEKMRHRLGVRYDEHSERYGENVVAEALTCIWCTSIWVALVITIPYMLFPATVSLLCLPLAVSAGAIVVEGLTDG